MENATINILISTSGSVIFGIFGMFFTANQLGKRIDDLCTDFKEVRTEFYTFKGVVNGRFAALDLEISKLVDRR